MKVLQEIQCGILTKIPGEYDAGCPWTTSGETLL